MPFFSVVAGSTYVLLCGVLLPVYLRFIYIFLSKKKYRSLRCYRIMVQMGIVQCLSMAPGFMLFGIAMILQYDPYGLANFFIALYPGGLRIEAVLGLVLALNRLEIICGFRPSRMAYLTLAIIAWMFGLTYIAILHTPYFGYTVSPKDFMPKYDPDKGFNRELQHYGYYVYAAPMVITLFIYIYILGYLIRLRTTHAGKIKRQERTIFAYAIIKFTMEFSLALGFNHYPFPHSPAFHFAMSLGLILSTMFLTPALYFALYCNLRREFFNFQSECTITVRSISS
uniref:7TM_GPCR_Srx domain-containing protein n=1 Tax=Steinernema glaseri TaxID=37863 RepID=A0A1I7YF01_9BILA